MLKRLPLFALGFTSVFSFAQSHSSFVLVDQFGYLPNSKKVAVIRDPQTGYDAGLSFSPSEKFFVKNADNSQIVLRTSPVAWKGGQTDAISGDKVWWVDFSSINENGRYYVEDSLSQTRSATFVIADTVYKSILKAAVRMLFYQRAGGEKLAIHAGEAWVDGASHLKPGQDKNARLFNNNTATTERDLSGGWYDAGDFNKYTPWTANYVVTLLKAYKENPSVWTDDYNIPESGNGIPDLLDEIKWGMDWLLKMQNEDGSCLSVMGVGHASPPSSATGLSKYGPATTNATLRSAAAFALGAKYLRQADPTYFGVYADTLQARALKAYEWGIANPSVKFNNNNAANGSTGLAAGNQETDSLGRFTAKMGAALYLYELTGTASYRTLFENGIATFPLIAWYEYLSQYFQESQQLLMYYTKLTGVSTTRVNQIRNNTLNAAKKAAGGDFAYALLSESDPYRAYIKDYNWGSNYYKSDYGNFFWELQQLGWDATNNAQYLTAAQDYLHYIHGVNPMSMVYLSNMSTYGAENSVNEFYHTWFTDKSAKWDRVGTSTYGPAPGFLTGGPNSSYSLDGCCPSGCGSSGNNALCSSVSNLPIGQPAMKSYLDFNNNWPLNSWSVTENSNGYQVAYIRLLSKFINGESPNSIQNESFAHEEYKLQLSPNPATNTLQVLLPNHEGGLLKVAILDAKGILQETIEMPNAGQISLSNLSVGLYLVKAESGGVVYVSKFVKH
jgi:endoglucanase